MCKITNMQDLKRNEENYFGRQKQNIFKYVYIFFSLILNLHYILKIKTCKMTKLLLTYKPRTAWFFLFVSSFSFINGMPCWFQGFLTSILYPTANSVCLLLDRWDVGCEPFPAGTQLALTRTAVPSRSILECCRGFPSRSQVWCWKC